LCLRASVCTGSNCVLCGGSTIGPVTLNLPAPVYLIVDGQNTADAGAYQLVIRPNMGADTPTFTATPSPTTTPTVPPTATGTLTAGVPTDTPTVTPTGTPTDTATSTPTPYCPPQNDLNTGTDASNECAGAPSIDPVNGAPYTGVLSASCSDLVDWYWFTMTAGGASTIRLVPPAGSDWDIYLYENTCTNLVNYSANTLDSPETIVYVPSSDGNFILRVVDYSQTDGTYGLTFDRNTFVCTQNDAGSGGDASSTCPGNIDLVSGVGITGTICMGVDEEDLYFVILGPSQSVSVLMTPDAGVDLDLWMYDGDCNTVTHTELGGDAPEVIVYTNPMAVTTVYYFDVWSYWFSGNYHLTATVY
jgi:hypothetical protein